MKRTYRATSAVAFDERLFNFTPCWVEQLVWLNALLVSQSVVRCFAVSIRFVRIQTFAKKLCSVLSLASDAVHLCDSNNHGSLVAVCSEAPLVGVIAPAIAL